MEKPASATAANQPNLDALWQAQRGLEQRNTDLSKQIDRLRVLAKVDEREALLDNLQRQRKTANTIQTLADAVSLLARKQEDRLVTEEDESLAVWAGNKAWRMKQVRNHLAHIRFLISECDQVTTKMCPCGKHQGIQFYRMANAEIIIVEENVCPLNWWIKLSRIQFEDRRLSQFVVEYPLNKFLLPYNLS